MACLLLIWPAARPTGAQVPEAAFDTRAPAYAVRGATMGGIALALVGGIAVSGLCDAADCDGAFLTGAIAGGIVGATTGGLAGWTLGAFGAAADSLAAARSWSPGGGLAVGVDLAHGHAAWTADVIIRRPTTARADAGLALHYARFRERAERRIDPDPVHGPVHALERQALQSLSALAVSRIDIGRAAVQPWLATRFGITYNRMRTDIEERTPAGEPVRAGVNSFPDHTTAFAGGLGLGASWQLGPFDLDLAADVTAYLGTEDGGNFLSAVRAVIMRR